MTTRTVGFSLCDCTHGAHDLKLWPGLGRSAIVDTEPEARQQIAYAPGCHIVRVIEQVETVDMAAVTS